MDQNDYNHYHCSTSDTAPMPKQVVEKVAQEAAQAAAAEQSYVAQVANPASGYQAPNYPAASAAPTYQAAPTAASYQAPNYQVGTQQAAPNYQMDGRQVAPTFNASRQAPQAPQAVPNYQAPNYSASPQAQPHAPQMPQIPTTQKAKRGPRHNVLSAILWLAMIATCALLALRLVPLEYASGRAVPELASLIPLAFIPSTVCLVLAVVWRRWILTVLCVAAITLNGVWHAGFFIPSAQVSAAAQSAVATCADTSDSYARIMTLNTAAGEADAEEIVRVCREQNVEILCLQEIKGTLVQDLIDAGIEEVLPYYVVSDEATSVSNGGKNGIWTATPMSNISYNLLPIETSSMPAADVVIGGTTVRIVSVHPNSPVRGAQDLWDEGLSTIGTLSEYDHSYLIMGDFNSTWDHSRFRDLLGTTFVDASEQSGEGFHMTYPANSTIPSLIEIDHIVYQRNSGIVVSALETVEIKGSDHKALLGTLEVS